MGTMKTVIYLLGLSSLALLVLPQDVSVTSFRANVKMVLGNLRIFSGETVQLRCSVPVTYSSDWSFLWFRGSEKLAQTGDTLILWNINVKESGKYSCHGERQSVVGPIHTQRSLPVEINVDGGWAILQASPHPALVGDRLKLTCHLRDNLPIHETILYKDGTEVMRLSGSNPHFYLTNVTLDNKGTYSCRASFDIRGQTLSVISVDTPVHILEVLSQPQLEIDVSSNLIGNNEMKLICHVQYNARAPAPQINYYFYKDNGQLGVSTSENHELVKRISGQYSCRARVPQLGLSRWSEPKSLNKTTFMSSS
ncbi:high affinity immunoglobulin epsilon receptor subunit alpha-like [Melanotaenia boesemani]|uniref:high affinity immunoglobulin epsilon receptor subunit alpha-like n=1 Tax=Melanotaenia boesemani TaxID=1250792 RepID=UPI001C03BA1A|nr:high affinity immunoglobulin epsilon receptor subunit alpha-like [Melanotaenia boesemani]